MAMLLVAFYGLYLAGNIQGVTIYHQGPLGQASRFSATATASVTQPVPSQSSLPAFDDATLQPPAPPGNQALNFSLNLASDSSSVSGLSIMQHGSFYGFSIEMSYLQVPFLNLLGQIQERAGEIHIRIGGNTQDFAYWVEEIDNGRSTSKEEGDADNPTLTPAVLYTDELFYTASNISSLVNVKWYFGIPFNDTNWRLQIAEKSQTILGTSLLGLQGGNKPDFLLSHGHRTAPYDVNEYADEFGSLIQAIQEDENIPVKNMLIGPSLAYGPWSPDRLWPTGYLDRFKDSLKFIAMEHYPSNNCSARFGIGSPVDPQETFAQFLNHDAVLGIVQPYLDTSARAQALSKPFLMFETNTATCGLPGISDSFDAALWAVDYGLTLATSNFSGALLHVGGQNDYNNPFTAPPENHPGIYQWTVGAIYYSVLVVAEIFGKSGVSQIIDTSNNNMYNPSYTVYDQGVLSKVVLINFIDDASGANDIMGTITIDDGQVPSQVFVKYLEASSVSVQGNITWAGQTFGNKFEADGRLKGDLNIVTFQCNQGANQCNIPLKAPSLAVVFFTDPSSVQEGPAPTFATTQAIKTANTATIDPFVLATSNGLSGKSRYPLGSTSPGSASRGQSLRPDVLMSTSLFLVAGVALFP